MQDDCENDGQRPAPGSTCRVRRDPGGAGGRRKERSTVMNFADLIVRDPKVCGGEPVVRGTRVLLRTILASLADGERVEDILRSFPTLTEQDVRAVIAFAAASAEEDLPTPGVPV